MARLALHKDFLLDFAKLEPPVQRRIVELLSKFDSTRHSGAHLEKINNARNSRYRSVRIDDFWRGIVLAPETGGTYTLLKVLPHDDAYQWARRRSVTVNHADYRIEIRDDEAMSAALPEIEEVARRSPARLLDHVQDRDLIRLGVDEETRAFARALIDVGQLDKAKKYLPTTQWEVLYGLAAGYTPDEVWAHLSVDASVGGVADGTDLDAAIARSGDRVVLIDGPDELMAVFANPFALWRIYLHPAQQTMVDGRFGGPVRVTGGPGTGKTVVALHRARRLAERGAGRVLVTTFSANLAATMTINFGLLVEDAPSRSRVDITNVDRLANQIVTEEHGRVVILSGKEQATIWEEIKRRLDVDLSAAFLADEWRHVMLAQQLTTLEEYQVAKRPGRGQRIGSRQRNRIWSAVCAFEAELARTERWTYETVVREAARLLQQRVDKPYRHVIVDEAQDLSPDQWRMLRAAVGHGGDDMFVTGDPHQRIYDNRVSLREVGVNITGRSRRLSINYRTTAEILGWSLAFLRGEGIDDMMGSLDSIAGCRSDVHGGMPTVIGSSSVAAEVRQIVNTVGRWVAAGIGLKEIGIAVRAKWLGELIEKQLVVADMDAELLGRARHTRGVAVATMHRMKGLEFRCVIVAGVSAGQVPAPMAVTPATEDAHKHALDMQRERCLLFVACTRAREELVVTWHGEPSEFLP